MIHESSGRTFNVIYHRPNKSFIQFFSYFFVVSSKYKCLWHFLPFSCISGHFLFIAKIDVLIIYSIFNLLEFFEFLTDF